MNRTVLVAVRVTVSCKRTTLVLLLVGTNTVDGIVPENTVDKLGVTVRVVVVTTIDDRVLVEAGAVVNVTTGEAETVRVVVRGPSGPIRLRSHLGPERARYSAAELTAGVVEALGLGVDEELGVVVDWVIGAGTVVVAMVIDDDTAAVDDEEVVGALDNASGLLADIVDLVQWAPAVLVRVVEIVVAETVVCTIVLVLVIIVELFPVLAK